ncbi:MAG: radical SAM protein [Deltaproteobacteria bacterium]|nr:radical SAM protein [Deltaproteobacteria bacterium]
MPLVYEGRMYRPPSEADALIVQATIGCSWNHCTYCEMYRDKAYRVRSTEEVCEELVEVAAEVGPYVKKLFVADGDALAMPLEAWLPLLETARKELPRLKRVSAYATAANLLEKSEDELRQLREAGLSRLYLGPESGDDPTLKAIAKGNDFAEHVEAARRAKAAGMEQSAIFLFGAGGTARSAEHAQGSARLATEMDPEFLALLTLTVVPGTPIAKLQAQGRFELPDQLGFLRELRTFVDLARPTDAVFRTNHASNYLPLRGKLPADREAMLEALDAALDGQIPLRPEWSRGL